MISMGVQRNEVCTQDTREVSYSPYLKVFVIKHKLKYIP